jgi:hypothetical protein
MVKLAAGTLARISAALGEKERRMSFLRDAIEREIMRREKKMAKKRPKPSN